MDDAGLRNPCTAARCPLDVGDLVSLLELLLDNAATDVGLV